MFESNEPGVAGWSGGMVYCCSVIAPLSAWRDCIASLVREVLGMTEVCCRGFFSVSRSARKRARTADFSVGRLGRVDNCF
ncbi:unnamed protein product [Ectocarpus sp. 13 AM-2016]